MSRRRCVIVGGGPAGLALSVRLARLDYDVEVYCEHDRTAGVGIVLDEDAIALLGQVDEEGTREILGACRSWETVQLRILDERIVSGGHHIRGIGRDTLVAVLARRATTLGVRLIPRRWEASSSRWQCDLLVGADGVGSAVRQAAVGDFGARVTTGATRFLWMQAEGILDAGFSFVATAHGAYVAHVYPYSARHSAIVVESRPECLASAGLLHADRPAVEQALSRIFAGHLRIGALRAVTFPWQPFRTVRNSRWHVGNRVLIGDAAHTAHFSVGSGTRLAIEDAVTLAAELGRDTDLETAVSRYQAQRRPAVARLQEDARSSEMWFADLDRHLRLPPHQLAFALRTRREVNGYAWLKRRDPQFVARLDATLRADRCFPRQPVPAAFPATEPRLLPLRLGPLVIPHRKVVLADGAEPVGHPDAGLVLCAPGHRATGAAAPTGLIAAAPGPETGELACLLLTGKWPEVRDALATWRPRAGRSSIGALLSPESWDEEQAPLLATLTDFVAVPIAPQGQRIQRTILAERLRNEQGLTVLLWTDALDADEANTLIAAGRMDGYVIAGKG